MTVAPSRTTMKNFHPRYRPLSQPLSTLYRGPPDESNLLYAPCSVFFLFLFCKRNVPHFLFFVPLGQVQKVKSALQHVVLAPWCNGPVQKVKSAVQHSTGTVARSVRSPKNTCERSSLSLAKDLRKLDGPHRSVDGARCRSPEDLCRLGGPHCCGVDGGRYRSSEISM